MFKWNELKYNMTCLSETEFYKEISWNGFGKATSYDDMSHDTDE